MHPRFLWAGAAAISLGLASLAADSAATPVAAGPGGQFVCASDPRFRYDGRFDFSDPGSPVAIWEASTISIDFTGGQVALLFGASSDQVFFDATVDGAATIVALRDGKPTTPVVLQAPGPGLHHLALFKRSEATAGTAHFRGVELEAGAAAFPPAVPSYALRMEFIGDSITVGACDEDGDKDQWEDRSTHDAAFSYAAVTARAFSADYRNISISGIGLATGYFDALAGQTWDRTYPSASSARADLGAWIPDVVLVLLGDNDDSYPRSRNLPFPGNFKEKYASLIHSIRGAYPKAHIVLLNGAMWAGTNSRELETAWGAVVLSLESQDPGVSDYTFVHWTNNHPRVADHRILAGELDAWLGRQKFMAAATAGAR